MTISFDATGDLAGSFDGRQTVTLRRREPGAIVTVAGALCRNATTSEAEPSGGHALQADADWYLQLPVSEAAPEPGDLVVDSSNEGWTVLACEQQSLLARFKCSTRCLRVALGCDDYVDVQRAVWEDLGQGLEITSWTDVYSALPVRIQPDETVLSDTTNAPVATVRFAIILGEAFPVEPDDRFVGTDAAIYRLELLEQAARIDKLAIARVVRVSP